MWNVNGCLYDEHWNHINEKHALQSDASWELIPGAGKVYKANKDDRLFRGWQTISVIIDETAYIWDSLVPGYYRESNSRIKIPRTIRDPNIYQTVLANELKKVENTDDSDPETKVFKIHFLHRFYIGSQNQKGFL